MQRVWGPGSVESGSLRHAAEIRCALLCPPPWRLRVQGNELTLCSDRCNRNPWASRFREGKSSLSASFQLPTAGMPGSQSRVARTCNVYYYAITGGQMLSCPVGGGQRMQDRIALHAPDFDSKCQGRAVCPCSIHCSVQRIWKDALMPKKQERGKKKGKQKHPGDLTFLLCEHAWFIGMNGSARRPCPLFPQAFCLIFCTWESTRRGGS